MADCLGKLYIGKGAQGMEARVRRALARGEDAPDLFLITFAANGTDQLDIVPARQLRKKSVRDTLPAVVGYAATREEGVELVGQMARDAYLATGTCHLQEYLLSIQKPEEDE